MLDAWSMSKTNNMELHSWNNGGDHYDQQQRSSSTSNIVVDIDLNETDGGGTNGHKSKNGECCSCSCSCARSQQKGSTTSSRRETLIGRFREFGANTTHHGLPYVIKSDNHILRR